MFGIVDQKTIDEINILNATKLGLTRAIEGLKTKPNIIMVDALNNIDTRDRIMKQWDEVYPIYGFSKHKGYGTAEHMRAIKENGPCILHRRSFIKNII